MGKRLTQAEIDCFHEHGFLPGIDVFSNDYTPPSARQSADKGSGQLVRGIDRWGHFGAEPIPAGACTREDVLARRRILNAYPENVLMGPLGPDGVISFADEPATDHWSGAEAE